MRMVFPPIPFPQYTFRIFRFFYFRIDLLMCVKHDFSYSMILDQLETNIICSNFGYVCDRFMWTDCLLGLDMSIVISSLAVVAVDSNTIFYVLVYLLWPGVPTYVIFVAMFTYQHGFEPLGSFGRVFQPLWIEMYSQSHRGERSYLRLSLHSTRSHSRDGVPTYTGDELSFPHDSGVIFSFYRTTTMSCHSRPENFFKRHWNKWKCDLDVALY